MVYNPRDPRRSGYSQVTIGFPQLTPFVRLLIIICTVAWFVQILALRGFQLDLASSQVRQLPGLVIWPGYLGLVPERVVHGFVWQPFSYMFLHSPGSLFHLLFNMLMLWMLGGDLERTWGSRPFLRYYLTCGVGAGIFALLLGLFSDQSWTIPTIGASGAIFGLVVAFGMLFGERTILFMMMFPMKARTFAWVMFGITLFSLIQSEGSGVSHIAHLGGAVTGFLYLKRAWRLGPFLSEMRWRLRRRRFRVLDRDDDYPFH